MPLSLLGQRGMDHSVALLHEDPLAAYRVVEFVGGLDRDGQQF